MVKFLKDESGAAAVEYGLLVGLIAIAIITATTELGEAIRSLFQTVANELNEVNANAQ